MATDGVVISVRVCFGAGCFSACGSCGMLSTATAIPGLAHGELEDPGAPFDDDWRGDMLALEEGTVVSLVERSRDAEEDIGTGDAVVRPVSAFSMSYTGFTSSYHWVPPIWLTLRDIR